MKTLQETDDTVTAEKRKSSNQKKNKVKNDAGLKENSIQKNQNTSSEVSISTISTGVDKSTGRMKVIIRIRPLNSIEKQSKANATTTIQANDDEKTLQIYNTDGKISVMSFDRVVGESSGQKLFFENSNVTDLICQALKGYAATVFAFGQTGSGKTYTITGPTEDVTIPDIVGLVPRALDFLFQEVNRLKEKKEISNIRIQASYMEIYNENVLDLLNPQNSGLPVRWTPERGFFVEHLYIVDCDSLDDSLAVLEEGLRNRTTAAHEMNEHSSRSHSILTIYLEIEGFDEQKQPQHRYGKINFVDLAGSEKVKESKTTLDTFAEALSINKSLLTLGKCITALADLKKRGGHIPFRDSKLTKLLADSLSGRGLALMIACISPACQNLNETLKTVRYAMQARKIQNRPIIQLDPQDEMVANFKMEILLLKKENTRLKLILEKDPKYQESLKLICEATEEYQKSQKSRPGSPFLMKVKPISYRDRLNSSIPSLPEIKDNTKAKNSKHMNGHSRSATTLSSFGSTPKKALTNALPARLTEHRKSVQPKSAAKQRIDEMKRSIAPAGHERTLSRKQALIKEKIEHEEKKDSPKSLKKTVNIEASKIRKNQKPTSRSITPHPNNKMIKRPSGLEHQPKLEKKPFPDHPHEGTKKKNEIDLERELQNHNRESSKKGSKGKKEPLIDKAKRNVDALKEIEEMENEILTLKRERDVATKIETKQKPKKRYQEEESHGKVYDWFGDFTLFEEALIEFLPSDKEKSIIHLGCGNSICGERLYKAGFHNIVNVDYSPTVIRTMKAMNEGIYPEMDWIVADIFDLKSALGDHLFDIAIDKGTLDSFLTISHDPWNPPKELLTKMENYMKSVALQLKPGGKFLHLTWAQPHFRKRFLELSKEFIVTSHTISKGAGGFDYFLYEAVKM